MRWRPTARATSTSARTSTGGDFNASSTSGWVRPPANCFRLRGRSEDQASLRPDALAKAQPSLFAATDRMSAAPFLSLIEGTHGTFSVRAHEHRSGPHLRYRRHAVHSAQAADRHRTALRADLDDA